MSDEAKTDIHPEPECPECGVKVNRPKCFLELNSLECPRHEIQKRWLTTQVEIKRVAATEDGDMSSFGGTLNGLPMVPAEEIMRLREENARLNHKLHILEVAFDERLQQARELLVDNARLNDRFTAPIVCICGSTKFKQAWIAENARLTGEGNIVLAVGFWGHHERIAPSPEIKEFLDGLHKRKVDLCDWVWVVDVGGYIGDSTRSEIAYAEQIGRPVRYLSKEMPDYVEPVDPLQEENARLTAELAEARKSMDLIARPLALDC
jgi:hypothetical protein